LISPRYLVVIYLPSRRILRPRIFSYPRVSRPEFLAVGIEVGALGATSRGKAFKKMTSNDVSEACSGHLLSFLI
jgi:hypothetical protein